jgi:glycerol-3-phosphate responsive antiterminator
MTHHQALKAAKAQKSLAALRVFLLDWSVGGLLSRTG